MARPNLTIAVGDWNALNVKLTYLAGRVQNLDESGDIPIGSVIVTSSDTVIVYDNSFFIVDDLDSTKRARFEVGGLSAATTRVYTLQDSDDTLVGRATTDTLTNKTWNGVKIGLAYGGTNADLSATGGANQLLKQASAGAAVTVGTIASANLSDSANIPLLDANNAFTGTETITFSGNTIALKVTDANIGIYTLQNAICFNYDQNADGIAAINWKGYQGGVTKYRDFIIYDGKANAVISVTASTAGVGLAGAITSGAWNGTKIGLAYGGTNADLSATGGAGRFLKQASVGAAITVTTVAASDIASGAALTKTDDTNVTLTLGGTPTAALLVAASLTLGWTGTLGLSRGGTNANLSATGGASQFLKQASAGAAITVAQPATTDLSDFVGWTAFTPSLSASAGTWSGGSVGAARYLIVGKTMTVTLYITGTAVSATPTNLTVTVPASKTAAQTAGTSFVYRDNGTAGTGLCRVVGTTAIQLFKDLNATAWATSVSTTDVVFTFSFEIQ